MRQLNLRVITAHNEVGAMLCFTRVCDSVHRGSGSAPLHAGICTPPTGPEAGTPPPAPGSRHHPAGPGAGPPRSRTPPSTVHAGRYGQQAGGTHPIGMQSCWQKFLSMTDTA